MSLHLILSSLHLALAPTPPLFADEALQSAGLAAVEPERKAQTETKTEAGTGQSAEAAEPEWQSEAAAGAILEENPAGTVETRQAAEPVVSGGQMEEAAADQIDASVVARANAYLAGLETVQGRFLQINDDGSAFEGDIYMDRPGKARFEYDDYPLLIVSDGLTVAQRDTALVTTDRAALKATPLYYLLKPDLDLAEDARIAAAGEAEGSAFVTLEDPDGEYDGWLTLYFSGPALELREWIATDPLGRETRFVLSDFNRARNLDPRLFIIDENEDRRGRR